MARKTEATETNKLVRLDNQKRATIINKYLTVGACNEIQRESAIEELALRNDYEVIEAYVYDELLTIGAPAGAVTRHLQKYYNLSSLAASYVVDEMVKHVCGSINLTNEYAKTLVNIDNNIAKINRVLAEATNTDTDLDLTGAFQELRAWTELKSRMINNGISNSILKAQTAADIAKNEVSLDDLKKQLEDLG